MILEELEHARARNARIYAEVCDFVSGTEHGHPIAMDPEGTVPFRLLSKIAKKIPD